MVNVLTKTDGRVDTILGASTEAGGQVTAFTVDRWGQALATTDPLGRVTTLTRSATTGLASSVLSFTGALDQFEFHAASGLPTKVTPAGQPETNIGYGVYSQVNAITGPGQPYRTFVLGPRGRVDQAVVTAATTYTTQYFYDTRHRVTSTIDPGGHSTTFTYDPVFGNQQTTTAPGSRITTRRFDGLGRDSTLDAPTLPQRRFAYDSLNRVTQEILGATPGVPQATTSYAYADKVNLTAVTDAAANVYQYVYNALGGITRSTDPSGVKDSTHYDTQGRAVAWASRVGGDSVLTSYDLLHRPIQVQAKRGATVMRSNSFVYDPAGFWVVGANAVTRDSIVMDATGFTTRVQTWFPATPGKSILRTYLKDANARLDSVHVSYPGDEHPAHGAEVRVERCHRHAHRSAGPGERTGIRV